MEYPLTASQMAFYPKGLPGEETMWNQGGAVIFRKKYSYEKINEAFNRAMQAHEELRLRIRISQDRPVAYIEEFRYTYYPFVSFSSREEVLTAEKTFINEPISIDGPLIRCSVFEADDISGILIAAHHIMIDGFSAHVVTAFMNDFLEGTHSADFIQSYAEHFNAELNYRNNPRYLRAREYWMEQFLSELPPLLFTDNSTSMEYRSSELVMDFPSSLFERIVRFCQDNRTSITAFFTTIIATYVQREFKRSEFMIGIPVLNRTTPQELNTAGLYMNILPVHMEFLEKSFLDCVKKAERAKMRVLRYRKFPQVEIQSLLSESGFPRSSLFDIIFDYQVFPENSNYELAIHYSDSLSVPLEMHFNTLAQGAHKLRIRYRKVLFSDEQICDMYHRLVSIADFALKNFGLPLIQIPQYKLNEKEWQRILVDFNCTEFTYSLPELGTLYSLFENCARSLTAEKCITAAGKSLTFGQLLSYTETLDTNIRRITKGRKNVVAVIAERSLEMYVGIYGALRGGNAYLPIDPSYPEDRVAYILKDSGAAVVLAQEQFLSLTGHVPSINLTEIINRPPAKAASLPCAALRDDTAYVIYTSGSTGKPKGAMISHRSAVNRILWMQEMYPLDKNSVILQKTPYTFDVSVWEIFWWGMCGGRLAVSAPGEHFLPVKILRDVHAYQVTHIHFVPSVFERFLAYLEEHPDQQLLFHSVRHVFLSGEALMSSLVRRFYKMFSFPDVRLHNLYGPTECAVDVTYYDCVPEETDPIPIGRPIYNTSAYILGPAMEPLPQKKQGELCIGGINVGQGYLNNPDLTAEKFVDNPFGPGRLYKTGDQAFMREDGQIVFCGRLDGQIKIGGQRIEIGEIEAVIRRIDGVETAAVVLRRESDLLSACYCGALQLEDTIRERCKKHLPAYMVPTFITRLEAMPLNISGKLDRQALAALPLDGVPSQTIEAPQTPEEQIVCGAFCAVLHRDVVGRSDNFFDLGGTSLDMISLLSADGFQDLSATVFIENATPAKLAKQMRLTHASVTLRRLRQGESGRKTLVLFPYAGGGAEAYAKFVVAAEHCAKEWSLYFAEYPHSIADCQKAADELQQLSQKTELYFYSHCAGCAPAMQIIRLLEERGAYIVKHYIAGASIPPAQIPQENFWNLVSNEKLQEILLKAGASLEGLSEEQISDLLARFRMDTDFMTDYFRKECGKILCPVSLIINKEDLFTENYEKAEALWKNYAEDVRGVFFIEASSHYFQSEDAGTLLKLICSCTEDEVK